MAGADEFCSSVLALDGAIRFAGVANADGTSVRFKYRAGLTPLLSSDETTKSMLQAVLRAGTRFTLEDKLGECLYTISMYRKVKRASITLRPPTVSDRRYGILMISMDNNADHDTILGGKVLPYLKNARLEF
jgi:hypothetical protein